MGTVLAPGDVLRGDGRGNVDLVKRGTGKVVPVVTNLEVAGNKMGFFRITCDLANQHGLAIRGSYDLNPFEMSLTEMGAKRINNIGH